MKIIHPGLLAAVLWTAPCIVKAQKLPTIQQISLRAPADIKTDGRATEWNNEFQAYNKATSVFYTIANDDENFYLTIQATDDVIIDKILSGGITLSFRSADKKNASAALTFPLIPTSNKSTIVNKIKNPETKIDEELETINNQLTTVSKQIRVTGIPAIADTLASVYNDYGLKVAGQLDKNKDYTCELALPLKYLQAFLNEGRLKYDVKLNGRDFKLTNMKLNGQAMDPNSAQANELIAKMGAQRGSMFSPEMLNPTDFSGTYTLSK